MCDLQSAYRTGDRQSAPHQADTSGELQCISDTKGTLAGRRTKCIGVRTRYPRELEEISPP